MIELYFIRRLSLASTCVVLFISFSFPVRSLGQAEAPAPRPAAKAAKYFRTELYMGRSIPGAGTVTDQEWTLFLAEIVTPLFPSGFTVVKAVGQFRESSGNIAREESEILIFLYPSATAKQSRAKIEEIRAAYAAKFGQESVMRVDLPRSVKVLF